MYLVKVNSNILIKKEQELTELLNTEEKQD